MFLRKTLYGFLYNTRKGNIIYDYESYFIQCQTKRYLMGQLSPKIILMPGDNCNLKIKMIMMTIFVIISFRAIPVTICSFMTLNNNYLLVTLSWIKLLPLFLQ